MSDENNYKLYLHFKKLNPSEETWMGYLQKKLQILISEWTLYEDRYIHVEISLAKGRDEPVTYYCDDKKVRHTIREFKSNSYESPLDFEIDESTYNKTKEFLEGAIDKPFNNKAYKMNFLPIIKHIAWFNVDANHEAYFCVELVAHALLIAGIIKDVKPYMLSTQDLYNLVYDPIKLRGLNFEARNTFHKMKLFSLE
jgi:hypothetical protein